MSIHLSAVNPATGESLGEIAGQSPESAQQFYARARAAFPGWARLAVAARVEYLRKLRLHLCAHIDSITSQLSEETGKAPAEALATEIVPVLEAIRHMERTAVASLSPQKQATPLLFIGKKSYVEFKPRGVVLVIAPWNFPFLLTVIPLLNAVTGGNTVILKPSEVTPRAGQLVEQLFHDSGWPQDVVQVAHGGRDLGAALCEGRPDYIFFTGSVRSGSAVAEVAARQLIPVTLELGGKDPMIVFADAPLDRAVHAAVWGSLMNSGQVCMSVERLYVERPLYENFVLRLVEEIGRLQQGSGAGADIGSMTSAQQVAIVRDQVQDALARGAKLLTGQPPAAWDLSRGLFIQPMVLTNVTPDMKLMREETFGPVLPVLPFRSEDEVIAFANDSAYGLSASVWSADVKRAQRIASRLVCGNALVNDVVITIANHNLPYGGEKSSGIGRYHGKAGLQLFCVQTSVMVDRGKRSRELNWFPYAGKYDLLRDLATNFYGPRRRWGRFLSAYRQLHRINRDADR